MAVGTHFHVQHGTKTTPVLLPAYEEASWSLFPSLASLLSGRRVQPGKHLFLSPRGDRSGQNNPKKDMHQH